MTEPPFRAMAEVYDRLYSWKDYAREARTIRSIVRRWGPHPSRTLLDVGCGTGAHLRHFVRWFECTGVDPNRTMIAVARRSVSNVRWVRAAMPEFDLHRRFDVIVCLFSSIGYVRDRPGLRRTLRTFARHLNPGGVVIVEPWLTPRAWRPGSVHLRTVPSKDEPIARMNDSATRHGRSVMTMHLLVAKAGRVHHWVERHEMSLFSHRTMLAAFRSAGLSVQRVPSGFAAERGLYIGRRRLTAGTRDRDPSRPRR